MVASGCAKSFDQCHERRHIKHKTQFGHEIHYIQLKQKLHVMLSSEVDRSYMKTLFFQIVYKYDKTLEDIIQILNNIVTPNPFHTHN